MLARPPLLPLHLKIRLRRIGKPVEPNPAEIAHKLASRHARSVAREVEQEANRIREQESSRMESNEPSATSKDPPSTSSLDTPAATPSSDT